MSQLRTTIGTAGAAMLLVVAAFHAGVSSVPQLAQTHVDAPLQGTDSDEEAIRDAVADDVGTNAVPGLGNAELLYVPITPCRIVDSRSGTGGYGTRLGDGSGRTYYVAGTTGFPTQGGKSGGCGVPVSAMAVSATMLAYQPSSDGAIKAWAATGTEPSSGNVMFYGSTSLGVGVTLPLTNGPGKDLKVRNVGSSTHLVIDVTGYYVPQLYAYIAPDGTLIDHSGRVTSSTRLATGVYQITWDRNIGACAGVATGDISGHIMSVYTDANLSYVYVDNNAGSPTDYYANVSIHC